ncbi:hypothetical protein [Denitromonas iodatirespirans]|uniref:Lipoprotein n=1 Tax=Denitromonas iodatirespirans TaxID=2795389 RepID=A0A944HAX9_DENI1|nr:hypothetical protein [Denitromonas iodatirespirans]MBT0959801.1 hypothetical protein [Denitromonas iodatirespirans]
MDRVKQFIIVATALLMAACSSAPKQPIAFNAETIKGESNRIAIQMGAVPEAITTFPGAGCLLCVGIAMAAHSDLSSHVHSLKPDELASLPQRLADTLRAQGAEVSILKEPVDLEALSSNSGKGDDSRQTEKDFRPLSERLGADKLLVITTYNSGVLRKYSQYVPVDVPEAFFWGVSYMVDLKSNTYVWYAPLNRSRKAEGAWNEPPNFPGLTNAYYQVLAESTDYLAGELSNKSDASSAKRVATATVQAK